MMTPTEVYKLAGVFFEDIWNRSLCHDALPGHENA